MSILPALIGGLGSVASAGLNLIGQSNTNKQNLALARQQNAWNEQMWNKNNEYNTPAAQLQRMKDAGINPLGADFQTGNAQSLPQSANLANQQAPNYSPMVDSFLSSTQNYVNSLKADVEVKDLQNQISNRDKASDRDQQRVANEQFISAFQKDKSLADIAGIEYNISALVQKTPEEVNLIRSQVQNTTANALLASAQRKKVLSEDEFIKLQKAWYSTLTSAQIESLRSGSYLNAQQANEIQTLLPSKLQQQQGIVQKIAAEVGQIVTDTSLTSWKAANEKYENWSRMVIGTGTNTSLWQMVPAVFGTFQKIKHHTTSIEDIHPNSYGSFQNPNLR